MIDTLLRKECMVKDLLTGKKYWYRVTPVPYTGCYRVQAWYGGRYWFVGYCSPSALKPFERGDILLVPDEYVTPYAAVAVMRPLELIASQYTVHTVDRCRSCGRRLVDATKPWGSSCYKRLHIANAKARLKELLFKE